MKKISAAQTAAYVSLFVSILVLTLKVKAYYVTHSSAVLSDALETVVNVVTAFIALYAVKLAAEPADSNHPYGHGKMEYFSAAFEGGLIFFAALAILYSGAVAFFQNTEVHNYAEGFYYSLAATIINLLTGLYLLNVGRKSNSEALMASGKHVLSDVVTTLGVFLSLGLVYIFKDPRIDAVISLCLGLLLAREAYKIVRVNSGALLDEADEELLEKLSLSLEQNRTAPVIDIHHLRMIRSGNFHHIDAHLVVPEFYDIKTVHDISNDFEKAVVTQYEFDGEFAFHTDPCHRLYCAVCRVEACPVREQAFKNLKPWTTQHIVAGPRYSEQE
ncbi:MAG: cation transporter [Bdellovibrio sp.]|nr:cation transporter [Bdellovibrio sp.]